MLTKVKLHVLSRHSCCFGDVALSLHDWMFVSFIGLRSERMVCAQSTKNNFPKGRPISIWYGNDKRFSSKTSQFHASQSPASTYLLQPHTWMQRTRRNCKLV